MCSRFFSTSSPLASVLLLSSSYVTPNGTNAAWRRRLAWAVVWVGIASVVQGFSIWRAGSPERVTGPQGNPNYLAAFLGTSATVLLLLEVRGLIGRRFAYSVTALAWVGCVITLSRTSFLAAILGLLVHWTCHSPKRHRVRRAITVGLTALVLLIGIGLYGPQLRARFVGVPGYSRQDRAAQFGQAISDLGRLEAGLYALDLITDSPALGVGFATFTARNYNENGVYLTTHDTYLQLLTGTGIVGGLLVVLLFYQLLRSISRRFRLFLLPTAVCLLVNAGFGDYMHAIDIFVVMAVAYLSVTAVLPDRPEPVSSWISPKSSCFPIGSQLSRGTHSGLRMRIGSDRVRRT